VMFADGVKHLGYQANQLSSMNREFIILSDADAAAVADKKKYERSPNKDCGPWYTYSDFGLHESIATGEDFVEESFFNLCVSRVMKKYYSDEKEIFTCHSSSPRMGQLETLLKSNESMRVEKNKFLNYVKDEIIQGLAPKYIREEYYFMLEQLHDSIDVNTVVNIKQKSA
jgi:hypothetical protein